MAQVQRVHEVLRHVWHRELVKKSDILTHSIERLTQLSCFRLAGLIDLTAVLAASIHEWIRKRSRWKKLLTVFGIEHIHLIILLCNIILADVLIINTTVQVGKRVHCHGGVHSLGLQILLEGNAIVVLEVGAKRLDIYYGFGRLRAVEGVQHRVLLQLLVRRVLVRILIILIRIIIRLL